MFDIGFSELVVIALVALIVIGPERLPKVARTAGILLGRLQRYVNDVKADINREMQGDELKKFQQLVSAETLDLKASLSQEVRAVQEALNQTIAPPQETPASDAAAAEPDKHTPANPLEIGQTPAAEKVKHG